MIYQINQLEKDKDVVAQAQAIATLEMLPQLSFTVVNTLNGILSDSKVCSMHVFVCVWLTFEVKEECVYVSLCLLGMKLLLIQLHVMRCSSHFPPLFCILKAFWRIRIEVAFALANTASEVL